MDFNILSWLIWVPVVGAVVIVALPRDKADVIKWVAAAFTGLQLIIAAVLWMNFDKDFVGFQFMEKAAWIPSFNITYMLGVDGLSLPMVALTDRKSVV